MPLSSFGAESTSESLVGPKPHVLSFSEWKSRQMTEANNRLARARNDLLLQQRRGVAEDRLVSLVKEHQKSLRAIEITKEFGIEDYFYVYLSKLGESKFVLKEAVKSLSADEVTELMQVLIRRSHQIRSAARTGLSGPKSSI